MIRKKHVLSMMMVALILVLSLIVAPSSEAGEIYGKSIKLGAIYSVSGVCAEWGNAAKIAGGIAIEEINAKGGIGGVPIEIVWYDVGCKAPPAIPVIEKLAKQDKVLAVNGP